MNTAQLINKWQSAKVRNSALVLRDMESLGPDYDTEGCMAALEEYRDIERCDYDDYDDYQDARNEAWEAVLEAMEAISDKREEELI